MEYPKIKTVINRSLILLPAILLALLGRCTYNNEQDLYLPGSENCDSASFTFSGTVFPIIQANCINCHNRAEPQSDVLLEDYTTISAAANIPSGQYGSLYGAITHNPGNSAMPKNGTKLSNCKIFQIKEWIDAGTPNN
jgi:hypothetical protein